MDRKKELELLEAIRNEKDLKTHTRMVGVRFVHSGSTVAFVAETMGVDGHTVRNWLRNYEERGIDGLRDRPRPGAKPEVKLGLLENTASELYKQLMLTPRMMCKRIEEKTGYKYSECNMRKILHKLGYSLTKTATKYMHAASSEKAKKWQKYTEGWILRMKREGYTIVVQDETILHRMGKDGLKCWSPKGERIVVERSTSKEKTVVYGAVADDKTSLVRQYDKFNADTCLDYFKQIPRKWGKTAVIMDNAPQHKNAKVDKFLEENSDVIQVLYLPVGTPQFSMIEAVWKELKHELLDGMHYPTLDDLKHAVAEYFRTRRIKLDINTYLLRTVTW